MQITRDVEGHYDENYQWVEGGETVIATAKGSIQPKSGRERADETGTKYESEYKAYIKKSDIVFEDGYSEIKAGDAIDDKYEVVFPGEWPNSYQPDLKVITNGS